MDYASVPSAKAVRIRGDILEGAVIQERHTPSVEDSHLDAISARLTSLKVDCALEKIREILELDRRSFNRVIIADEVGLPPRLVGTVLSMDGMVTAQRQKAEASTVAS